MKVEGGGWWRKTEKVTRKEVNTHGPCRHTPSCCHRQLLHQLTGHFPLHYYIHRGQGQAHHHRYHQQGPSTHDWICLNGKKKREGHLAVVLTTAGTHFHTHNTQQTCTFFWLLGSAHTSFISLLCTFSTSVPCHCSAALCSTIPFYRPYRQLQGTK